MAPLLAGGLSPDFSRLEDPQHPPGSICRAAAAAEPSRPLAAALLPAPQSSAIQSARALPGCCSGPFFHAGHVPAPEEDEWGGQAAARAAGNPAVTEAAAHSRTSEQPLPPICAASSSAALPLPLQACRAWPFTSGIGFFISLKDFSSIGKNTGFIFPLSLTIFPFPTLVRAPGEVKRGFL